MPLRRLPKPRLWTPSPLLAPIFRDVAAALDPARLLESAGLEPPEPWQRNVMRSVAKRLAVLCPRQSGEKHDGSGTCPAPCFI
jgi:hypothetical protein